MRDADRVSGDDAEAEYLLSELGDFKVVCAATGAAFGVVFDVLSNADDTNDGDADFVPLGHAFLELELPCPDGDDPSPTATRKHVLVPLADAIVPRVDVKTRTIYINPPEGLLDLTFNFTPPPPRIAGLLPHSAGDAPADSIGKA